jgi:hypothetical protein
MTANVIRVTLTGWIMYDIDPSYAVGAFHTIEGLLMMGLGLAMLGRAAGCSIGRPASSDRAPDLAPARPGPDRPDEPKPRVETPLARRRGPEPARSRLMSPIRRSSSAWRSSRPASPPRRGSSRSP